MKLLCILNRMVCRFELCRLWGNYVPPKCFPPPNGISIYFADTNGNNLIGMKYSKDSIRLAVSNVNLDILRSNTFLSFLCSGFDNYNDLNYYLYLSKSDTDTINMTVTKENTNCGTEYHCTEFKYNSKIITAEPNSYLQYKIVKK